MNEKKSLAKIALAAMILAATTPGSGQAATPGGEREGTFLAAACGRNSCQGQKGAFADNGMRNNPPRYYPEQVSNNSMYLLNDLAQNGVGNINGGRFVNSNEAYQEAYYNSYDTNRSDDISPTYMDNPRGTGYYSTQGIRGDEGFNTNLNRQYNTVNDYDYNRASVNTVTSSATLTEAHLLGALNPRARAIYLSLDPQGKALAIQLASEDSYRDKNLAVIEAQRRMNERRGLMINR